MRKRKHYAAIIGCVIALLLLISGCSSAENTTVSASTTSSMLAKRTTTITTKSGEKDLQIARAALVKFFRLLHEGKYSEVTKLYGGSYEFLRNWNPVVDKNNHAALLKAGCERQLQCMLARRITRERQLSQDTFEFAVEFTAPDGGVFVQGPFPGETEDQATRFFNYIVKKTGDRFLVQDTPPYLP